MLYFLIIFGAIAAVAVLAWLYFYWQHRLNCRASDANEIKAAIEAVLKERAAKYVAEKAKKDKQKEFGKVLCGIGFYEPFCSTMVSLMQTSRDFTEKHNWPITISLNNTESSYILIRDIANFLLKGGKGVVNSNFLGMYLKEGLSPLLDKLEDASFVFLLRFSLSDIDSKDSKAVRALLLEKYIKKAFGGDSPSAVKKNDFLKDTEEKILQSLKTVITSYTGLIAFFRNTSTQLPEFHYKGKFLSIDELNAHLLLKPCSLEYMDWVKASNLDGNEQDKARAYDFLTTFILPCILEPQFLGPLNFIELFYVINSFSEKPEVQTQILTAYFEQLDQKPINYEKPLQDSILLELDADRKLIENFRRKCQLALLCLDVNKSDYALTLMEHLLSESPNLRNWFCEDCFLELLKKIQVKEIQLRQDSQTDKREKLVNRCFNYFIWRAKDSQQEKSPPSPLTMKELVSAVDTFQEADHQKSIKNYIYSQQDRLLKDHSTLFDLEYIGDYKKFFGEIVVLEHLLTDEACFLAFCNKANMIETVNVDSFVDNIIKFFPGWKNLFLTWSAGYKENIWNSSCCEEVRSSLLQAYRTYSEKLSSGWVRQSTSNDLVKSVADRINDHVLLPSNDPTENDNEPENRIC